jgi:hypothetical protein
MEIAMYKFSCLGLVVLFALGAPQTALAKPNAGRKAPDRIAVEIAKDIAVGNGVLCNSADQIRRYLTLYRGDTAPEAAVQLVNTETRSPGGCGFAHVAFKPSQFVGSVTVSGGVMRIFRVTVFAHRTKQGWATISPTPQFTAVFEEAEEA